MSDNLRKGVGEQVSEKVTPDSQKSTTTKIGESISGGADKAAGAVQPCMLSLPVYPQSYLSPHLQLHTIQYTNSYFTADSKSTTQGLTDKTRGGADDAQSEGKGILGSVSDTAGNAANTVSDTLSNAGMSFLYLLFNLPQF